MRVFSLTLPIVIALSLTPALHAEFPLSTMGPRNLGIQYGLTFRGQNITSKDVPSHEIIHAFTLGYSPLPYLGLEAGLGLDRFLVDRYNTTRFRGEYGISPVMGITLATPYALDFVRLAAGSRFLYLNSEDANGFAYSGWISSPWLAVIATPSTYIDFLIGARGHGIDGSMEGPSETSSHFMNREIFRGLLSFTIKSPGERAFLTLDVDFSPSVDSDWSNGPNEASVGISFGTLLGWKAKDPNSNTAPQYFPAYKDMKDKQDQMAEETK